MLATIFYKLLSMSLIAAVIGLIILIIRRFFDKKIPPIWKYIMWSLVIIALIMPFKLQTKLSLFSANNKIEKTITNTIDKVLLDEGVKTPIQNVDKNEVENFEVSEETLKPSQEVSYNDLNNIESQRKFSMALLFNKHFILKNLIPVIWLLGTSLILLAFAFTRFKLLKNQNNSSISDEEFSRIKTILSDCKAKFNIQKDIQIKIQDNISSPAIMGIFRPTIFLPNYVSNMSESSISHILYHELAHYQRQDTIVNYLLLIFNAVYWFNPLIWLIFKFIRDDIEILTDEFVINKIGKENSKTYSKSLVEVLANANKIPFMPKMLCMVDGKKNIERRISMIKLGESFKKHKLMISVICLAVIAVIAGVFFTVSSDKDEEDEKIIWDKAPMVYVEGSLYVTDPHTSVAKSKLEEGYVYIGEIKTEVDGSLEPKNNFESNCYGVGTKVYKKDDVLMLEGSDGKYEKFIKVNQAKDDNKEHSNEEYPVNQEVADKVEKAIEELLSLYPEDIDQQAIQNENTYQEILKMGDDALNYMLNEFKNGRGEDNRGLIMMIASREILGAKDNAEGEFYSGMDWYKKFRMREEVKIDNFEYSGDDEELKLVYNSKEFYDKITSYFEDGGFHVSSVKIYETSYEEDYLKVFFHLIFLKYKLYIDDDGEYVLDETGGLSAPYAITYEKDENGKYQYVKCDMPKDGAYFGSSIEDFCTTPLTNTKIEGLATRMVVSLGDKELLQENLMEHLSKNNIKDVFVNGEGYELINHRQSSKDFVGGKMLWPLDKENNDITSYYAEATDDTSIGHMGIDVAAPKGANIYAVLDGEVIVSKYSEVDGQTITIHHGGGIITRYAHASERLATVGQTVKKGDVIAKVGATGRATGNHLHFEVRKDGDSVNPLDYLSQP